MHVTTERIAREQVRMHTTEDYHDTSQREPGITAITSNQKHEEVVVRREKA